VDRNTLAIHAEQLDPAMIKDILRVIAWSARVNPTIQAAAALAERFRAWSR
jgi:hypothetical protein